MSKTFVLHDESLNSQGFWMMTKGADLEQFKKNPIMLLNHSHPWRGSEDEILPIGHWENIRIDGDKILADPVFDSDEFSQKIALKVESGTLRMASMGVRVTEQSDDPKLIKPGQRYATVTKWKAREASIVDIGSNDNALALYDDKGNLIELSASGNEIPLKEVQIQNDIEMKEVTKLLELTDKATEQEIVEAITRITEENVTLRADLQAREDEKKALQEKLDATELKEKQAKTNQAKALIAEAIKDGRVDEDEKKTAEAFWLRNFEADFDGTSAQLARLPKKTNLSDRFDGDTKGGGIWEKRQREIEENSKK